MSWTGEYWGKNGAVALAKQRFESSQKSTFDYVAYASACYSCANRVFADIAHLRWSGVNRLVSGFKLSRLAVRLTDQIVLRDLKFSKTAINEYADTLDVGCAVYFRYGWLCGGRRKTLGRWIKNVGYLIDECNDEGHQLVPHTIAFLVLHEVRFAGKGLKSQSPLYSNVLTLAYKTSGNKNLEQSARVYRQLAKIIIINDNFDKKRKKSLLKTAKWLAEKAGATDQLAKL
jgi:hypothetical protein